MSIQVSEVIRTCVGCRQRERQSDLLRLVMRNSELLPDERFRQAGRGAYLHYDRECLVAAERRRAFSRAFRTDRSLSFGRITETIEQTATHQNQFGSQSGDEMSTQ